MAEDSNDLKTSMLNGFQTMTGTEIPSMKNADGSTQSEKVPTYLNATNTVAVFEEEIVLPSRDETEKIKFTSTFSTYMTLLGYSIGMSDFWRFPFLAYRNGGGMLL